MKTIERLVDGVTRHAAYAAKDLREAADLLESLKLTPGERLDLDNTAHLDFVDGWLSMIDSHLQELAYYYAQYCALIGKPLEVDDYDQVVMRNLDGRRTWYHDGLRRWEEDGKKLTEFEEAMERYATFGNLPEYIRKPEYHRAILQLMRQGVTVGDKGNEE